MRNVRREDAILAQHDKCTEEVMDKLVHGIIQQFRRQCPHRLRQLRRESGIDDNDPSRDEEVIKNFLDSPCGMGDLSAVIKFRTNPNCIPPERTLEIAAGDEPSFRERLHYFFCRICRISKDHFRDQAKVTND